MVGIKLTTLLPKLIQLNILLIICSTVISGGGQKYPQYRKWIQYTLEPMYSNCKIITRDFYPNYLTQYKPQQNHLQKFNLDTKVNCLVQDSRLLCNQETTRW